MLKELVKKNRSYRRFYQDDKIDESKLRELVDLARQTPSAANKQPLKYILSNTDEKNGKIFSTLAWAGYLKDWDGPEEGERPSAYIIILNDTSISKTVYCDHGIVSQTILLGAVEKGLGGCILASIKKKKLSDLLNIPPGYDILLVISLGKPKEEVVMERVDSSSNIKYWRDDKSIHHVPKRDIDDIILNL
jgi:nitroreductase